jgi:type I restriction enzyme S subunit
MVPYMRAANVTWDGIELSDVKEMDFTPAEQAVYRLQDADILLSEASGSAHEVGKPAIWRDQLVNCCFQNTLIRVRAAEPSLGPYLHRHFLADALTGRFGAASRGVGIHHLGAEAMSEWEVVIPPAKEREELVAALDSHLSRLDEARALLERVKRNLKRYRASVLKAAVEGRLVPTEAELARAEKRDYEPASVLLERILVERRERWESEGRRGKYVEPEPPDTKNLPELPEGWCWTTVAAVGGVTLGRQRAPQYLTGRYNRPYLRVANVKDDRIDFSDVEQMDFDTIHFEKYKLIPGDILVSEGQSPHLVGQSAIYRGGHEGLCFQKTLHRWRPVPGGPTSEYAQVVFRAHVRNGVFMRLASITTNIAHLTLEKFEAAPFPLAPAAEQERIVVAASEALSLADSFTESVRVQLMRAPRLRQSILKWAFEGKLVDQDPNDEPASALLARIQAEQPTAPAKKAASRRAKTPA